MNGGVIASENGETRGGPGSTLSETPGSKKIVFCRDGRGFRRLPTGAVGKRIGKTGFCHGERQRKSCGKAEKCQIVTVKCQIRPPIFGKNG
jgi:hypothetical protein